MDGRDLTLSLGLVSLCAVLEFVCVRFSFNAVKLACGSCLLFPWLVVCGTNQSFRNML